MDHESNQFSKDSTCLHKSDESSQMFSTQAHYKQVGIHTNPVFQIGKSLLYSKDKSRGLSHSVQITRCGDFFIGQTLIIK